MTLMVSMIEFPKHHLITLVFYWAVLYRLDRMKLKKIQTIFFALTLSLSVSAGFVLTGGGQYQNAYAYKCVGNPDDFYFEDPGSSGENKAKLSPGITGEQVNFRWDAAMGRCVVTVGDLDASYKSQYDDGSPRDCNDPTKEKQQKVDGQWRCVPQVTRSTNDKPVNDDGSPIDASQHFCGGEQDNYDAESFSCKESGSCNLTFTCDYNKVGLKEDPTADCVGGGGVYNKNNNPTCTFTQDSCTKAGKKLDSKTNRCAELDDCDKQYGDPGQKKQHDVCEASRDDPNTDCEQQPNAVLKAACEVGQAVFGSGGNFGSCGEAQTVLVGCEEKDCGVGGGAFSGVPVIGCVLKYGIQALTVLVGVAAVAGIAWEAVQYARAQDDQSIVSGAKNRIRDIVIGLFVYGFMIAIINWLVPGGVIK